MKRIKITLILLVSVVVAVTNLSAQVSKNIVDTTKVWYEHFIGRVVYTTCFKLQGDTIIDDKTYMKVYVSYYNAYTYANYDSTYSFNGVLLREDSNRVYCRILYKPSYCDYEEDRFKDEFVLYDFNLNEGDSVFVYPFDGKFWGSRDLRIVNKVDTINVNGINFKQIELEPADKTSYDPYSELKWIEGIGSTYGFLSLFEGVDVGRTSLACCTQNGELIYSSNMYYGGPGGYDRECLFYASDNLIDFANNITIYPNPANNYITVKCNTRDCKLLLYDGFGRIVRNIVLNDTDVIEIENLISGVYTAVILRGNMIIKTEKIVKL